MRLQCSLFVCKCAHANFREPRLELDRAKYQHLDLTEHGIGHALTHEVNILGKGACRAVDTETTTWIDRESLFNVDIWLIVPPSPADVNPSPAMPGLIPVQTVAYQGPEVGMHGYLAVPLFVFVDFFICCSRRFL
jgi:hypothetical protein